MGANVMLVVERKFNYPQSTVFAAWTDPRQMSCWRGSPGWHVEENSVSSQLEVGGRHHHVKVRDDDPSTRVTTEAVFTEFFEPDVFVAHQRITGDDGIDPETPMELRGEFTRYGRGDSGTLVRIVQGPYEPNQAASHSTGWEAELDRLENFLSGRSREADQA